MRSQPQKIVPFTSPAAGVARVPGSKSITNRALICALLSRKGVRVRLEGVLRSDDTEAMLRATQALGAETRSLPADDPNATIVELKGTFDAAMAKAARMPSHRAVSRADLLRIAYGGTSYDETAAERRDPNPWRRFELDACIDALSAGTAARFLLAVLAGRQGTYALDADRQMQQRPLQELVTALERIGARFSIASERLPAQPATVPFPLLIRGRKLQGGPLWIRGDTSSQFLSALLLAAPSYSEGLVIELAQPDKAVSRSYVAMTLAVMRAFDIEVRAAHDPMSDRYEVAPGGYLRDHSDEPFVYSIEPDATAASYFWAAAAITGGSVTVAGLTFDSLQGDVQFVRVLEQMGCQISQQDNALTVTGPSGGHQLRGGEFDLSDFSDCTQTLAAVAAFASEPVTITGVGFIRHKESDRIGLTVQELNKRGIKAVETADGLRIHPEPSAIRPGVVSTYDDHRMAMAMSLLGTCTLGIQIDNPECVSKTFPNYFTALEQLRQPNLSPASPTHTSPAHTSLDQTHNEPVIAIDGPAASGKSSVAKRVATQVLRRPLKDCYLDTGAMYRSVAWAALDRGIDPFDVEAVGELAEGLNIVISYEPNANSPAVQLVTIDGRPANDQIRTPAVDKAVSVVATNANVRKALVRQQKRWIEDHAPAVVEGRDIGSVVVPDAALKIYLTASEQERAQRRRLQQALPTDIPGPTNLPGIDSTGTAINQRDQRDSSRQESPLQVAPGAVIIDTSDLSLDQVVDEIAALYQQTTSSAQVNQGN